MSSDRQHSEGLPQVPLSWGDLIDKITILELKSARIPQGAARSNSLKELDMLLEIAGPLLAERTDVAEVKHRLSLINGKLWDIEDRLRRAEAAKAFDEEFITLARSVYMTNDERARLKREINVMTSSALIEEKHYVKY
jgi:hypothetical protein